MSYLAMGSNGRWSLDGYELTSGESIQLNVPMGKLRCWLHGRIEHDHDGYYFLWLDAKGGEGIRMDLRCGSIARRT